MVKIALLLFVVSVTAAHAQGVPYDPLKAQKNGAIGQAWNDAAGCMFDFARSRLVGGERDRATIVDQTIAFCRHELDGVYVISSIAPPADMNTKLASMAGRAVDILAKERR